jgi:RimJ/RimL family protein N-acetyltransferase
MMHLLSADDRHFAWMIAGGVGGTFAGLTLPPDGIAELPILELFRRVAADLRLRHGFGFWLTVHDNEVIGSCGYMRPPSQDGQIEIGYGIATARQKQGFATLALAALMEQTADDATVDKVTAETAVDNRASQRVLEKNGFVSCRPDRTPEMAT